MICQTLLAGLFHCYVLLINVFQQMCKLFVPPGLTGLKKIRVKIPRNIYRSADLHVQ